MSHSGVIFDLDGTLADTLDDIACSLNHALASLDRPALPTAEVRRMVGHGLTVLSAQALGSDDPLLLARLVAAFSAHHANHFLDRTRLYPGVADMLDALTRRNVSPTVLSNKPHEFTGKVVDGLLHRWSFAAVEGVRAEGTRKPDPTVAWAIARTMGRSPAEMVIVGDSAADIETARNAGMRSVAVTWGFRDRGELLTENPDALADSPAEVVHIIDRWASVH